MTWEPLCPAAHISASSLERLCWEPLQMTSHSSPRSSGWGAVAWLLWAPCEWLNLLVSRWRRQPGGPTPHSSSDEVTAGTDPATHSLVTQPGVGPTCSQEPGSSSRQGTFWVSGGGPWTCLHFPSFKAGGPVPCPLPGRLWLSPVAGNPTSGVALRRAPVGSSLLGKPASLPGSPGRTVQLRARHLPVKHVTFPGTFFQ